eukprot:370814_1
MEMVEPWFACTASLPDHYNVAILNDHEFIMSSHSGALDIQKYNIHRNEWTMMAKCPSLIEYVEFGSMLFAEHQNKLYIRSRSPFELVGEKMVIINFNTRQLMTMDLRPIFGILGAMVNVNGVIHAIADRSQRKHFTWDINNNTVTQIFDFHEYFGSIVNPSMIYIKSKQMILLIGGRDHCSTEKYNCEFIGIWRFCLKTNKWKQMIKGNKCQWYCVSTLSANGDYVIISTDTENNGMYVLNVKNRDDFILNKCNIKCPGNNSNIIRMGNSINSNVVVTGWIRKLFETSEFEMLILPPKYLMEFIALYYEQEMIHWMGDVYDVNCHYSIKLKDILKSITANCNQ